MPAYSSTVPPFALYPGDSETVWSAESPATNAASEQVALSFDTVNGYLQVVSVQINFSGTPGAFKIDVQTADTDVDAAYQVLPANTGQVSAVGGSGDYCSIAVQVKAKFVRLFMTLQPANSVTTTAQITR